MRVPLWIGGPLVIALSAVDAALALQGRAVRGLTRTVIRTMSDDPHVHLVDAAWADDEASRSA